jgi:hypothetical protein
VRYQSLPIIALAAAEELTAAATGKKVRYVASDEHPAREVAKVLSVAIGKPDLQWVALTDAQTQKGLKQNGMPAHAARMLVELGAAIHSGVMLQGLPITEQSYTTACPKLGDSVRRAAGR